MAEAQDREIVCCDCSQPFVFTAGEQTYFAGGGLSAPKRCAPMSSRKTR
jgi:hypothetical protein